MSLILDLFNPDGYYDFDPCYDEVYQSYGGYGEYQGYAFMFGGIPGMPGGGFGGPSSYDPFGILAMPGMFGMDSLCCK